MVDPKRNLQVRGSGVSGLRILRKDKRGKKTKFFPKGQQSTT
jgi:hypothetical protein